MKSWHLSKPCNYGLVFSRGLAGRGEPSVFIVENAMDSGIIGFGSSAYIAPLYIKEKKQ